ncbi:papain-like cysteine protease family protein [Pyxidicoccus caerfyrddinensis]|jgi:hypothetical protein|uniref:papain-like cysteine protease family protein n=1 Tax=Pyxidicoccus caerfyrddinensis TaxID=2709663 RepID=UPI0013DBF59C|nr:papain-like cysteine protease family protein [Pyxidicoccus caerfyrddinensis]
MLNKKLLLASLLMSGAASASWVDRPVTLIAQQYDQWCHAASIDMVATYWGDSFWTQCDIVKKEFGSTTCPNSPTASIDQTCTGLQAMGYLCSVNYAPLTFAQSFSDVYTNNRPFIPRIGWTSGGGHIMVMRGVDDVGQYVKYNNPLPVGTGSTSSWVTYTYFKNNSSWNWTHTVWNIRK